MKKIITTGLSIAVASFLFMGCGSSSSEDKNKTSPADVTEKNSKMVMEDLITNPKNFDDVNYSVGELIKRSVTNVQCQSGYVKIQRDIDNFKNLEEKRKNILTFNRCKNNSGEIFDGQVELEYIPHITSYLNLTEKTLIESADKNITILKTYTYFNGSDYNITIEKGSRLESNLDENGNYRYKTLTIDAIVDGKNYKSNNIKTRTYAKSTTMTKLCYLSGRIYIDNSTKYLDIIEDNSCINEFIWVNSNLQAGGQVELISGDVEEDLKLKLEATNQNQITAYKNGNILVTFDTKPNTDLTK